MADLAALTAAVEAGNRTAAAQQTQAALDAGDRPAHDPGRHDRGHGRGGPQVPGGRAVRPRDAHRRPGDEGRHGAARARPPRRRGHARAPGHRGHRRGGPPRHRQEPRGHDVEGRRHRGHRPRRQRPRGALRRGGHRARRPPHRPVGAADHDHAQHARRGGGHPGRRTCPPRSSWAAPRSPPSSPTRSAPTASPPTPGPRWTWPAACWPADVPASATAGQGSRRS